MAGYDLAMAGRIGLFLCEWQTQHDIDDPGGGSSGFPMLAMDDLQFMACFNPSTTRVSGLKF